MRRPLLLVVALVAAIAPVIVRPAPPAPPPLAREEEFAAAKERCQRGDAAACARGLRILDAIKAEAKARAELATELRGCESDDGRACLGAALTLGFEVAGVRNLERSAALARKACDLGEPMGCAVLGVAHLDGKGVARDPARAAALLRPACERGDALGCGGLGVLHVRGSGVKRDLARAKELFRRACQAQLQEFCALAEAPADHEIERGHEVSVMASSIAGCQMGELKDCELLGITYSAAGPTRSEESQLGMHLLRRTCARGRAGACLFLARWYQLGHPLTGQDPAKAAELRERACGLDPGLCPSPEEDRDR